MTFLVATLQLCRLLCGYLKKDIANAKEGGVLPTVQLAEIILALVYVQGVKDP